MKRWLARILLGWLGYHPPCIVVPRGSHLTLSARGPIELRAGGWGSGDAPLFLIDGELTFDGGDWSGGDFRSGVS